MKNTESDKQKGLTLNEGNNQLEQQLVRMVFTPGPTPPGWNVLLNRFSRRADLHVLTSAQ